MESYLQVLHNSDLDWGWSSPSQIYPPYAVRRQQVQQIVLLSILQFCDGWGSGNWAVKMGIRRQCRLWWPSNLLSQTPPNSSFLFGWFLPSSEASLDVVVAFACDEPKLISSLNSGLDLQVRNTFPVSDY